MAELDEIVPMPEGTEGDPWLRNRAQFSHQFSPSDTSLAQRARGNADKAAYAASLQDRRRQMEMEELKTNKVAQDLYFRNRKMASDLAAATQKMRFEAEIHPEKLRAEQAKTAANLALERKRTKENELTALTDAHEARFFADRADFLLRNPAASQEQLDANDISLRDRYPHSRSGKEAKPILEIAEKNSLARQREAERLARPSANSPEWIDDNSMRIGTSVFRYDDKGNLIKVGVEPQRGTGTGTDKPDSWAKLNSDVENAVKMHKDKPGGKIPPELDASFQARRAAITAAASPVSAPGMTPAMGDAKQSDRAEDAPAVAAANPRVELARRALNDPAASEAHKAAARKILGQ
jgi:hypothetical protein